MKYRSKEVNEKAIKIAIEEERKANEKMALHFLLADFHNQMELRVKTKLEQGYSGWDKPENVSSEDLIEKLEDNTYEKDWIDVAVLACFLWNREK